jgi:hypothetical protein
MAYVPKNMVNQNLYTNGGEFIDPSTGKYYQGYYHQYFSGEIFSGKGPTDANRKGLSSAPPVSKQSQNNVPNTKQSIDYQRAKPTDQEIYKFGLTPEPYYPVPTSQDYKKGAFVRYFAKKRNQSPPTIIEIDKVTHDDLRLQRGKYNYALWTVTSLYWKITGPIRDSKDKFGVLKAGIYNTNERIVNASNEQFRGIKGYLSDLIQFAPKADLELVTNVYASKGQLIVKLDNSEYEGYYHVMADGNIMDGATHEQSTGKILLAGDVLVQNQISTLVNTALGELGAP